MAQNPMQLPTDPLMMQPQDQPMQMAAPQASQMAPVDPHATLTAPIAAAPPEMPRMSAMASQKGHISKNLMADYQKDADPWGSPDNHPGKLGSFLHDVSAAVPGIMRQFKGTTANRQLDEEPQLETRLQNIAKEESTEGLQGAQAGEAGALQKQHEADTTQIPLTAAREDAKAKSEEGLQGAQAGEATARTNALNNPTPEWAVSDTDAGPILFNKTSGVAQHLTIDGEPVGPKLKLTESQPIIGADGKPHTYMLDEKGNKKVDLGVHYEKPNEAPGVTMLVPNGAGGETVQRLTPGQTVAPGAQTAAGVNAVNTPTMQQRTASGRAATVVAMAPEVLSRIDAVAPKLGPIAGRWNDFMQGKVGSGDPDFAALRSDLLMMSSAVALAHAQGRLPENLREEFDHAINAPKQTPENLKATINTMIPWLQKMQQQGRPDQQGGTNAPIVQHSASTGQDRYSTDGGKTWQQGKPQSQK